MLVDAEVAEGADADAAADVDASAAADSASLLRLLDFLDSSMSMLSTIVSGNVTSFKTMSSSSPEVASSALPAWPGAVLVGVCWLGFTLCWVESSEAFPA